jgi:hypothetical protein
MVFYMVFYMVFVTFRICYKLFLCTETTRVELWVLFLKRTPRIMKRHDFKNCPKSFFYWSKHVSTHFQHHQTYDPGYQDWLSEVTKVLYVW